MLKHFEGAKLGIFIFMGTVIFVFAVFLIGNKDSLFVSTIHVNSIFTNVDGLQTGAPVRLSGMDIGAVTDIGLVDDTTGLVKVSMRIENTVKHLVRLNSTATITTEGLVGKKIVLIEPGSIDQVIISDGGTIKSVQPVNISEIIEETQSALSYFNEISENFSEISKKINDGQGTIGKLVNDDELYYSVVEITQTADTSLDKIVQKLDSVSDFVLNLGGGVQSILAHVDSMVLDINSIVDRVEKGEGMLGGLINDDSTLDSVKTIINNLVKTTEFAIEGANGFAENMEALKHNWLFKTYFEERGYWDRAEYEADIDRKLAKLKEENEKLEEKLDQLKQLRSNIENNQD